MKQPILLWCEWGELFARSLRNAGQPAQGSPSAWSEALTNGFCAPSVWLDPQRLHTSRVSMERLVSTVATAEPEGWKAVWEALACPPAPSRSAVCLSGEGAEADQPALCRQGVRSQVFCQPPLPWPEDCPGHLCGCSVSSVQSLRRVRLSATPWTAARQASLSITSSRSPPKPMSIESVRPSNHLTFWVLRLFILFSKLPWKGKQGVPFLLLDESISGKALCDHFQTPYPPRSLSFSLPSFNGLRDHHCFCSFDCRVQLFVHFLTSLMFYYSNVFLQWKILSKIPPKIPDIGPSDFLG